MAEILNLYKPLGITPKQAIDRYRSLHPEYKDVKMGYAGRLDPMAEGVLPVLVGEATKHMEEYIGEDKEYIATILFGIATDSFDVLGIPIHADKVPHIEEKDIQSALAALHGTARLPIPLFSAYRVKGKPLFWWAKRDRLDEVPQPMQDVDIYEAELEEAETITGKQLLGDVLERVDMVKGDFRQEEIMSAWQKMIGEHNKDEYPLARVRIACSTGTYVRSIAQRLGEELHTKALLHHLVRTQVGKHRIENAVSLE